jgi:hypothetical protein
MEKEGVMVENKYISARLKYKGLPLFFTTNHLPNGLLTKLDW